MKISDIIWLPQIVEKLAQRHNVNRREVREVLDSTRHFRFAEKGHESGEDVYSALGQTEAGRYLAVYFIYKKGKQALVLSARDMTTKERRRYGKT